MTDTLIAIGLTLVAALLNASSSILQRREASSFRASDLFSRNLTVRLVKNRNWLLGMLAQVLAFLFQAAALKSGTLTVVQPVLTVDLIFMLAILAIFFHARFGMREWLGAIAIAGGLSGLLVVANPRGGHLAFNIGQWAVAASAVTVLAVILAYVGHRLSNPSWRAALMGLGAGAGFSLTAAITKLTVHRLTESGFLSLFSSWEIYGLILFGAASLFLVQNTYTAGPLAASQPAMMIADPVVSATIGIYIFGDIITHTPPAIWLEAACAAILAVGVMMLAGSPAVHQTGEIK